MSSVHYLSAKVNRPLSLSHVLTILHIIRVTPKHTCTANVTPTHIVYVTSTKLLFMLPLQFMRSVHILPLYLHCYWLFKFALLLYTIHQVTSVDKFHDKVKSVLKILYTNCIVLQIDIYPNRILNDKEIKAYIL